MNQPRLINGLQATYEAAAYDGEDTSGILAIGPNVVVLCDKCTGASAGGILYTEDKTELFDMASEQGIIVQVGAGAFRIFEDGRPWDGYKPVPGDRVYFEKYAGRMAMGVDGKTYRIMTYTQIAAVYQRASKAPTIQDQKPIRHEPAVLAPKAARG